MGKEIPQSNFLGPIAKQQEKRQNDISPEKCSKLLRQASPSGQFHRISIATWKKNYTEVCALFTWTLFWFILHHLTEVLWGILFRRVSKAFPTNWLLSEGMSVSTRYVNVLAEQGFWDVYSSIFKTYIYIYIKFYISMDRICFIPVFTPLADSEYELK